MTTAALDDRVRGVASIWGVDPLRLGTPGKGTEGIPHYSHLHGLIPRLGFFLGHEDRIPFDYDEVLALVAPKPVLIVAPEKDRYARIDDVRKVLEAPAGAYRARGRQMDVWTPDDFNRFPVSLQQQVYGGPAKLP